MTQKKVYLLLLLLLCAIALPATTYYLDYSGGANGNNGLSPATAWKDYFKVRAAFPAPGDTFLFKRGEVWPGLQMYIDASGTMAQPIVYGAYGDPTDPLPILSGRGILPGSDQPESWTEGEAGVWQMQLPSSPGRLFLDSTEVLRAHEFQDLGIADNTGATGQWYWNASNTTLYLLSPQNPASQYGRIEGSLHFETAQVFASDYLEFHELDIRGGWGASLSLRGSQHIVVRQCALGRSANSGLTIIDQDLSGVRRAAAFITVRDNTFDSGFTFFYGSGSERGCGDGLKLFYGAHSCSIFANTFTNWAHNALELLGNRSDAEGVYDNHIHDNYITAPDIPYAHPLGMDGLLNKCRDNEFYRNLIEDCRTTAQVNGNNNAVHHNIIVGMRNSPSKEQPTAFAFAMGIYGANLVSQDNQFDHNLIIDTDEAAFQIRSFGWSGTVKGHQIRNNIIYQVGQAPYDERYAVGTGMELYDPDTTGVGGNVIQNNLFYHSQSDSNFVFVRDSATHYSVAAFNALNGVDTNTIAGNLFGDPLFLDQAGGDYQPQAGSPAIDAALDLGYAVDYDQMPRQQGATPDIGPLETNYPDPCTSVAGDSIVYEPLFLGALDTLSAGTYASFDTFDLSGGRVYAGDSVTALAGETIVLRAGFSVQAGAHFSAQVTDLCTLSAPSAYRESRPYLAHNSHTTASTLRIAPNPAYNRVQISYQLQQEGPVRLKMFNLQGQQVRTILASARQAAGNYRLELSVAAERPGIYILLLEQNGQSCVRRMVIHRD